METHVPHVVHVLQRLQQLQVLQQLQLLHVSLAWSTGTACVPIHNIHSKGIDRNPCERRKMAYGQVTMIFHLLFCENVICRFKANHEAMK